MHTHDSYSLAAALQQQLHQIMADLVSLLLYIHTTHRAKQQLHQIMADIVSLFLYIHTTHRAKQQLCSSSCIRSWQNETH